MKEPNDKILERIKKLLAMSKDLASENEAAIATKRLHALLAEYNLSLADVENDDQPDVDSEELLFNTGQNRAWRFELFASIAKLYFCSCYRYRGDDVGHRRALFVIIGSSVNRMTALAIANAVSDSIERESIRASWEEMGCRSKPFTDSFRAAAARRVTERTRELIAKAKAGRLETESGETLPALLGAYDSAKLLADQFLADQGIHLAKGTGGSKPSHRRGMARGREHGDRVGLNTQLHQQRAPRLLK